MGSSVRYLAEHFEQVPVLVVPTVARRYGGASTFQQASRWGSILPAVWSLHLALRSRGLGSAWTTLHLYREREAAELLGIAPVKGGHILLPAKAAMRVEADGRVMVRQGMTDIGTGSYTIIAQIAA